MYLAADWLKWPDVAQQASRMRYASKHTSTDTPLPRTSIEHGVPSYRLNQQNLCFGCQNSA